PRSARIWPHQGPASTRLRSRTRIPLNAPISHTLSTRPARNAAGLVYMARMAVCSDALDDHGQALADTDAQADDRITLAAALQFTRGRKRQTGTGSAQRVTHGDGAAIRVHTRI